MKQLNDQRRRKGLNDSFLPAIILVVLVAAFVRIGYSCARANEQKPVRPGYLGSSKCRSCHEKFYQLWAPSHHGLAMQPYSEEFAEKNLTFQEEEIAIKPYAYRAVIDEGPGYVLQTGPGGQHKYPILHALGGKNVYYFLTELERGHLQVLPVAFDIRRQRWFDTAASGVRHFPERDEDEPLNWKDRPYTFNSSCYGCHVSQLVKNYDPKTDTYNTQWQEPGINCETCHGPAEEHVRVCQEAGQGTVPDDLKLITVTQGRGYTPEQVDAACLSCHAKASAITAAFVPGDTFFQHYDLVTLEHPDYYPDGRDLGENYTFTSWSMNPCAKPGKLDCLYCHTSSGRYRFKGEKANDACGSCHKDKQTSFSKHSHHDPKTGVTECIQCHMPKTEFGRMIRSDHSFRPPMPSATIRYKSPNACNICHANKDAQWADKKVREWGDGDCQKRTLEIADLIDQARKENWENLSSMLEYVQRNDREEVFANSLIRLLRNCSDKRVGPVLAKVLAKDSAPLLRASAADALSQYLEPKFVDVLALATADTYRLVRIRAASTLSLVPTEQIPSKYRPAVQKATEEFLDAMTARPDDASSHYNLGNFYMNRNDLNQAIDRFEFAIKLDKNLILPYVNASIVYNRQGNNEKALESLRHANKIDPDNLAVNLNLALLYGEMDRLDQAEAAFRKTFELDPQSAVAAYNLCVLLGQKDLQASINWGRKAHQLQPDNDRYAYTLAFYLHQNNKNDEVIALLEPYVARQTPEVSIYMLLASIYEQLGNRSSAIRIYETAAENKQLSESIRSQFRMHIQQLISQ